MKFNRVLLCLIINSLLISFTFSSAYATLGDGFNENLITEQNLTGNQAKLETAANGLVGTIIYIVQILSVAGVVIMGVRYMLSSAEKRANIKAESISLIIGLVIVFATSFVIDLIVTSAEEIL